MSEEWVGPQGGRSTTETFLWVVFLLYLTAGSSGGVWFLIDRVSDW